MKCWCYFEENVVVVDVEFSVEDFGCIEVELLFVVGECYDEVGMFFVDL